MKAAIIRDEKDLTGVVELLKENNLPYQDIDLKGNLFVSYADDNGNLLGAGGLELYRDLALLRSVVVKKEQRGKKLGQKIVSDLLSHARNKSIKKVYLLTETAPEFFLKLGFTSTPRESVPDLLKSSSEFTFVCPVSAACMEFQLK